MAAACLLLAVFQGFVAGNLSWWVWGLLLTSAATLAVRSKFPRAVLLAALVTSVLAASSNELAFFPAMPILLAVGAVAAMGHIALAALVVMVTVGKMLMMEHFSAAAGVSEQHVLEFMVLLGWLIASLTFGVLVRYYSLASQEAQLRVEEMQRAQEEMGLRRAGEERLRIARELHDSLVHAISVIKVQAGVAVHLAGKRGEAVPETTRSIQAAANIASRELKQTLTMLRDGQSERGIAQLPELVSLTEMTGLQVEVDVDERLHDSGRSLLPATVDHTVYRIVQEALTNATRHSTGDRATVQISFSDPVLTVAVHDNGHVSESVNLRDGSGLRGMMERVNALGGTMRTEKHTTGGLRLQARLPIVETT